MNNKFLMNDDFELIEDPGPNIDLDVDMMLDYLDTGIYIGSKLEAAVANRQRDAYKQACQNWQINREKMAEELRRLLKGHPRYE